MPKRRRPAMERAMKRDYLRDLRDCVNEITMLWPTSLTTTTLSRFKELLRRDLCANDGCQLSVIVIDRHLDQLEEVFTVVECDDLEEPCRKRTQTTFDLDDADRKQVDEKEVGGAGRAVHGDNPKCSSKVLTTWASFTNSWITLLQDIQAEKDITKVVQIMQDQRIEFEHALSRYWNPPTEQLSSSLSTDTTPPTKRRRRDRDESAPAMESSTSPTNCGGPTTPEGLPFSIIIPLERKSTGNDISTVEQWLPVGLGLANWSASHKTRTRVKAPRMEEDS